MSTKEQSNLVLNNKRLSLEEEYKVSPLLDEFYLEEFGVTLKDSFNNFCFPMDKAINYTAFLHRLVPDQRKKLLNFEKLNIENDTKEDIKVFLKAFHERGSVNTISETFQKGVSALVAADIISSRQIDYIMGN